MSLTQQRLKAVLTYSPETGVFVWRDTSSRRFKAGDVAGCRTPTGRILIGIDGKLYRAHRLAYLWMTGSWPGPEVDHKDHDPSNNAWDNLRTGDKSFNMQNLVRAKSTNISGMLGVSAQAGRWYAKIYAGGKKVSLGGFGDPYSAHEAYVSAKRDLHAGGTL